MCVCVSVVTDLAGAIYTRTLRPQLRYQKKALDTRIKQTYIGIELKIGSPKVMTLTISSSPRKLLGGAFDLKCATSRPLLLLQDYWRVKRCF